MFLGYGDIMKRNGYSAAEMLVVVVILGILTMVVLGSTSNAFKDNSNEIYEERVYLIEHQAVLYAKTLTNLESEGNLVITLDDVVNSGYYVADTDDGKVIDPRNSKGTLNGLKIKLNYNGGDIKADVIEED